MPTGREGSALELVHDVEPGPVGGYGYTDPMTSSDAGNDQTASVRAASQWLTDHPEHRPDLARDAPQPDAGVILVR